MQERAKTPLVLLTTSKARCFICRKKPIELALKRRLLTLVSRFETALR
jgi:hypothetical protein